jgi:hypothetical protein
MDAPDALTPIKEAPVPTVYDAGKGTDLVWTLSRRAKFIIYSRNQTLVPLPPTPILVAMKKAI